MSAGLELAQSLGVPFGPDFGRLQRGETVNGVAPEQVIGPARPGRKVVFSGDTRPCETVAIAAQASLPVLNLSLDLYRGWVGVIVYPGEFVIRKTVEDEDGVVHEIEQDASGEAWEGGPVVLSWEDAQMTDGTDAYNVVIHEFAHKIDMLTGEADGHPPLFRRWHAPLDATAWADVFDAAYDQFCAKVDAVPERRWARFERDSLIDPYAADHPSEFFAVCSEALFVQPRAFEAEYPELYRLLARFYRQDPARVGALWPETRPGPAK